MHSSVRHLNLNTHAHITIKTSVNCGAECGASTKRDHEHDSYTRLLTGAFNTFIYPRQSRDITYAHCRPMHFYFRFTFAFEMHYISICIPHNEMMCVRVRPCPRVYIVSNIVWCGIVRMTPDIIYEDDYVIRTMASYEWKANGNERGLRTFYTVFSFLLHFNCTGFCWIVEKYGPK